LNGFGAFGSALHLAVIQANSEAVEKLLRN